MNMIQAIKHDDLYELATSYDYDDAFFAPLYARLQEKILAYDPNNFSTELSQHLNRVERSATSFLTYMKYEAHEVKNLARAFALHDLGKILDPTHIWHITKEKPNLSHLTKEQKAARKIEREKHTRSGPIVLRETLAELSLVPNGVQKAHIDLVERLMLTHHERLDGTGPIGLKAAHLGKTIRILAVIDTLDGKWKNGKSLEQNIQEMTADSKKYDATISQEYGHHLGIKPISPAQGLANPSLS